MSLLGVTGWHQYVTAWRDGWHRRGRRRCRRPARFARCHADLTTCAATARWLRSVLPPVLRPFTQLHAWWHVFAGYASYIHILYCLKARCNIRHQKSEACFGPMGFTVRRLPSHRAEANGHTDNCNNLKHLD
ncbi:uncharacterized protein LOC119109835 [Pollicipes pollicipes]|uniref:uncharacterized protein LOC119109835 n=1 Tax=Pollicipes pollicipes TaxID=41117 RepID=UPI0018855B8A|nr:uncharacterized protein LOC119109835 [Pollicipes pollicipes]